MRTVTLIVLAGLLSALTGCVILTRYSSYLENEDYEQGLDSAMTAIRENPQDAYANFYAGRFLLALDRIEEARTHLERATVLEPSDADYHFWLGVACWSLMDFDAERAEYFEALRLDPDHFSANLYLGHAYMDQGEWGPALAQYDKVLKDYPYEPGALYNRAVALLELGRDQEAREALKTFLTYYPDGSMGIQATDMLNGLGDFTWRNHAIGLRTVTLHAVGFAPASAFDFAFGSTASLDVLGSMLENNQDLTLHVVVYVEGDKALAKKRAQRIKSYLSFSFAGADKEQILTSWFGQGETVAVDNRETFLKESVNFFTRVD